MLSTIHFDHVVAHPAVAHRTESLVLNGDFEGTLVSGHATGRNSYTTIMAFNGDIAAFNPANVIWTTSNDRAGKLSRLDLTIKGARGSVQLRSHAADLISDPSTPFAGKYTVIGGQGAFAHARGAGTLKLTTSSGEGNLHLSFRATR